MVQGRGGKRALGRPFGPLCVPCRPPVSPRSIFGLLWLSFWDHFEGPNRLKIMSLGFCLRVAFEMGFGVVLGLFGRTFVVP